MRGGPGWEFWTPGDERGGALGIGDQLAARSSGRRAVAVRSRRLQRMWRTFWGADLDRLSPSNRRAVVPGAWRLEVSPARGRARRPLPARARDRRSRCATAAGRSGSTATTWRAPSSSGHGGALVRTAAVSPAEAEATLPDVPRRHAARGWPAGGHVVRGPDHVELRARLARRPRCWCGQRCRSRAARPRRPPERPLRRIAAAHAA